MLTQSFRLAFEAPVASRVFGGLLALLVLSFFVLPDQAGRNLVLYLAALTGHAFLLRGRGRRLAYGHPGGWIVVALVLFPLMSLVWSTEASADQVKDLLVAGYCVLIIYVGLAWLLDDQPVIADRLASLLAVAGSLTGAAAIFWWILSAASGGGHRLQGIWGIDNPVHASVLLLGGTVPVLAQVLRGSRSRWWLLGLLVPACFVLLSGARTAAGAYLLVVVAMTAARRPRAAAWVLAGTLVLAVGAVVLLGTEMTAEVWLARGLSYRDLVWQQVWQAYGNCNALVGCGIATPLSLEFAGKVGDRAHGIFLAALYHQGLLGLLIFVVGVGWLLARALRPQTPAGSPLRAWGWMLGYVLLANLTSGDHILVRADLFWPSFWLPVMVTAAMSRESSRPGST